MAAARLVMICLLATTLSVAAEPVGLFDDDGIPELVLSGPFEAIFDEGDKKHQRAFELTSDGHTFRIDVSVRGHSRLRVCAFPPLRLYLEDSDSAGTRFEGWGKLKLVTHCRGIPRSQKDVLEEYAVYQMFSLLADAAMQTQLFSIRYVDTDTGEETTRYGFLLEPEKAMARRLGTRKAKLTALKRSWLEPEQAAMVYVFAYLVGNTDWSLVMADADDQCCHNGILLERGPEDLYYVPYDFDLTGLVNAPYAKPDPALRISKVTTRRYRGYCIDREYLATAVDRIVSKRQELEAVIYGLPMLDDKERGRHLDWLGKFFRQAENRKKMLDGFERRCL